MHWNRCTQIALVWLFLMFFVSCQAWDALNTNVPQYTPPESYSQRRPPSQIRLVFYKKLQRQPLTVTQRQQVIEASASDFSPYEARIVKQKVWDRVRKQPLVGLSIQLLPKGGAEGEEIPEHIQRTDGQGTVFFPDAHTYFDHTPEVYEVRVDLSRHPFFHEVKYAVKEPYTSFLIRPEDGTRSMGAGDEIEIHLLLNWDGEIVIRIDQ